MSDKDSSNIIINNIKLYQKISAGIAITFGIVSVALIVSYCQHDTVIGSHEWLGRTNLTDHIFNLHPILMISGFSCSCITAVCSYRLLPFNHNTQKLLHFIFHTLTIACMSFGFTAVILKNNYKSHNTTHTFHSNITSNHNFMGLATMGLYFLNYLFGFLVYGLQIVNLEIRQLFMPYHVLVGIICIFLAHSAIQSGLMDCFSDKGCGYTPTKPVYNPSEEYFDKLQTGCIVFNQISITVVIALVFTMVAIIDIGSRFTTNADRNTTANIVMVKKNQIMSI